MKFIKEFIYRRRVQDHQRRMEELRSGFNIKEKGGCLWLMYDDVAIMDVRPDMDSKDIADSLAAIRNSAVKYQSL